MQSMRSPTFSDLVTLCWKHWEQVNKLQPLARGQVIPKTHPQWCRVRTCHTHAEVQTVMKFKAATTRRRRKLR